MANLTITVDDEVLRRARIRALEQSTSVNQLLREYLETYAGLRDELRALADEIVAASEAATSGGVQRWSRDELYDERVRRRG